MPMLTRTTAASGFGLSPGISQAVNLDSARVLSSRHSCCTCRFLPARQRLRGPPHGRRRRHQLSRRRASMRTVALVSVEFNPALLLGLGIMGSGVVLYQLRQTRTAISRDTDLFISCICLCSGGILVFQGWRLDPLLLLCQLFTTTIALSYAWEALNARTSAPAQPEQQGRAADPRSRAGQQRDSQAYEYEQGRAYELPPPAEERYSDWAGRDDSARWRDESSWQPAGTRQDPQQAEWQAGYARSSSRAGPSRDSQRSYTSSGPAYASYDEQPSRQLRDQRRDQDAPYESRQADSRRNSSKDSSTAGQTDSQMRLDRRKGNWSSGIDTATSQGEDWDLYS